MAGFDDITKSPAGAVQDKEPISEGSEAKQGNTLYELPPIPQKRDTKEQTAEAPIKFTLPDGQRFTYNDLPDGSTEQIFERKHSTLTIRGQMVP